ncbi:hypothetical protein IAQ61_006473 [Plenodomus lingam]|uniref:uncharacterized protein n=1 Tax=Leptosphaeria maculans TaxID=5022 RepID=UPI00331F8821|nr:hypothetical protein IAQ61_006473 [Plenodomus lingam]
MNIVFAHLLQSFATMAAKSSSQQNTSSAFMKIINQYVLYILYLFLGRFILAYIAIVSLFQHVKSGKISDPMFSE